MKKVRGKDEEVVRLVKEIKKAGVKKIKFKEHSRAWAERVVYSFLFPGDVSGSFHTENLPIMQNLISSML